MEKVLLKDLLGREVATLQTGSELLLCSRLQYYLMKYANKQLSLDGVTIKSLLLNTCYFSLLQESQIDMPMYDNRKYTTYDVEFYTGEIEEAVMRSQTDELWVYDVSVNPTVNNFITCGLKGPSAYVSMVAYLLVYRFVNHTHTSLRIEHTKYQPRDYEFSDLLILLNYGSKLIDNEVVEISGSYSLDTAIWVAFVTMHRQQGQMSREYTAAEKRKLAAKKFAIGDVVLLYSRAKVANTIKTLESCYPAVIQNMTNTGIDLCFYPCIETELTRRKNIESVKEQTMYGLDDIKRFPERHEHLEWIDIGVEWMLWDERKFIYSVLPSDGTMQWLSDGINAEQVFLSTPETIYAVFEDRGVKYNKNSFLQRYFGRNVPIWEKYKRMQNLNQKR